MEIKMGNVDNNAYQLEKKNIQMLWINKFSVFAINSVDCNQWSTQLQLNLFAFV